MRSAASNETYAYSCRTVHRLNLSSGLAHARHPTRTKGHKPRGPDGQLCPAGTYISCGNPGRMAHRDWTRPLVSHHVALYSGAHSGNCGRVCRTHSYGVEGRRKKLLTTKKARTAEFREDRKKNGDSLPLLCAALAIFTVKILRCLRQHWQIRIISTLERSIASGE